MAARILVADDEPATTELLALILEHDGFEVVRALRGDEALELALSRRVDAALLDVMMPGMDGREVSRRLRAATDWGRKPIVLFSSANEEDVDWKGAGADAFLQKAFRIRAVPRLVRGLLDGVAR